MGRSPGHEPEEKPAEIRSAGRRGSRGRLLANGQGSLGEGLLDELMAAICNFQSLSGQTRRRDEREQFLQQISLWAESNGPDSPQPPIHTQPRPTKPSWKSCWDPKANPNRQPHSDLEEEGFMLGSRPHPPSTCTVAHHSQSSGPLCLHSSERITQTDLRSAGKKNEKREGAFGSLVCWKMCSAQHGVLIVCWVHGGIRRGW
ncbi:uncharacterized protein LOC142003345 [Carettochelys insculpta]|uniref:uncharacterized protein LOC142003345 n=1 Tax=Carettochelys insculpta TaxID=44489 RepID=UPI003EBA21E9